MLRQLGALSRAFGRVRKAPIPKHREIWLNRLHQWRRMQVAEPLVRSLLQAFHLQAFSC